MEIDSAIVLIIVAVFSIWQHFKIRARDRYINDMQRQLDIVKGEKLKFEKSNMVLCSSIVMLEEAWKELNAAVTKKVEEDARRTFWDSRKG